MRTVHRSIVPSVVLSAIGLIAAVATAVWNGGEALGAQNGGRPGTPGVPYANMPAIAPIGVSIDTYFDVPETAKGPAIDPAKGYRTEKLGDGLYMVTDGAYQSMFMTHEHGVVVVDAPPSFATHIPKAIAEVSDKAITHLVYSHAHSDHIGGAKALGGRPIIVAHAETNRLLARQKDPSRPAATVTFDDTYRLPLGSQALELSYHGNAHLPGNIFIYAPKQRVLMVVDLIFPGWMPWRRFAVAQDVLGYFDQVKKVNEWDFVTLVAGHVGRTGTSADVVMQLAFMEDLRGAADSALKRTKPGEGFNPTVRGNPWAFYDHYIDRVVVDCVNQLTPKWSSKLAAFDVYIWDQCYSMEQTLRIE